VQETRRTTTESRDPNRLWCNEHNIYEDECLLCHPELAQQKETELRDPNRLWCREHDIYEDECLLCHPELAQQKETELRDPDRLWCNEHDIYEDECLLCHPELAQQKETELRDPDRLWCNEHDIYEDECLLCHPELAQQKEAELRDPDRLWCNEHDIYEDECLLCHPELAQQEETKLRDPKRLWCNEHDIYEDECLLCHPELAQQEETKLRNSKRLWCNEHEVAEIECGICQPDLLKQLPYGQGMKVRFNSGDAVLRAGVALGRPNVAASRTTSDLLGEIAFDGNRLAAVTPLGGGVIKDVLVDVGDSVASGQILATVTSPAIAEGINDYLKVKSELGLHQEVYAREKKLFDQGISARQDFEVAQAALSQSQSEQAHARQHLVNLGMRVEAVDALTRANSGESVLPVRAAFAGTVVQRDAVVGTAVEPGKRLFQVADLSKMWMELSIPEKQLGTIKLGTSIQARFDALPGMALEGTLTWVAYTVDERTRLVKARVELDNTHGLLRQGMFGQARVAGASEFAALSVPEAAVQVVDGLPIVFAKLEADLFEARPVRLGNAENGVVPVLSGLSANDDIVIAESFVMKSEFLKARLGAGCVHQ
jgi:cobalt-zinc-cadmium efflux system membrane fusion protein